MPKPNRHLSGETGSTPITEHLIDRTDGKFYFVLMAKIMTAHKNPSALLFERGVREGLEIAARIADRHSSLQQQYAEACDGRMPNSSYAFVLQKVTAMRVASDIREASKDAGRSSEQ